MIYFGLSLFEHRIQSWIRFYKSESKYVEYSTDNETFLAHCMDLLKVGEYLESYAAGTWEDEPLERNTDILAGLAGTFSIKVRYEQNTKEFTVQDARHIEPSKGGRNLTKAFENEFCVQTLTNLFNKVGSRDVEALNTLFKLYRQIAGVNY